MGADGKTVRKLKGAVPLPPVMLQAVLAKLAEVGGWVTFGPRELCLTGFKVKFDQGMSAWSKVVWFSLDEDCTKWVAFTDGPNLEAALMSGLQAMLSGELRWQPDRPWEPQK